MGWTVILEDENRLAKSSISHEFDTGLKNELNGLKLLHYLDPYGDAIFNRLQMDDLIMDLQKLRLLEANPLLDEIEALAQRCKKESHLYLVFYGD